MQVTLTKDLEKFILQKVKTGGYADPSEVVRDALRTFREKDDPAELDSQELADLLLPAVRGEASAPNRTAFRPIASPCPTPAGSRMSLTIHRADFFWADFLK